MIKFDAIILLGGNGQRAELGYNKVLYKVNGKPLFYYSLVKLLAMENLNKLIIVTKEDEMEFVSSFVSTIPTSKEIGYSLSGKTRQESVLSGLKEVEKDYVLVHDGARPLIDLKDICEVVKRLEDNDSVSLVSKASESMRLFDSDRNEVIDRGNIYNMKTPQGLKTSLLKEALEKARQDNKEFTDDVSSVEYYFGIKPCLVNSDNINIKVTNKEDLEIVKGLLQYNNDYLVGQSNDTHRLEKGEGITLGGVFIPCEFKIVAHSDGDALFHAIVEAIIGALGKGDIGTIFPDNNPKYKGVSSSLFMMEARKMLDEAGYEIVNLDSTIYIERPMMHPYILNMEENISSLLNTKSFRINVKATRKEKLGDIGLSKAVMAEAIILLKKVI